MFDVLHTLPLIIFSYRYDFINRWYFYCIAFLSFFYYNLLFLFINFAMILKNISINLIEHYRSPAPLQYHSTWMMILFLCNRKKQINNPTHHHPFQNRPMIVKSQHRSQQRMMSRKIQQQQLVRRAVLRKKCH